MVGGSMERYLDIDLSTGAVEEKRLPIAPDPRRVWEHAFFWVVVLTLMAFVFEDSGGRTRFANSMQTGLVISIVMLSIVLITGYTGQISLAQMSLAWVLRGGRVTSALIGASRLAQIEENLKCLEKPDFTDEELKSIDAVLKGSN